METKRRQYSEELKREAVEYNLTSGKSVKKVAKDPGIPCHKLDHWRAQYRKRGELASPGHGRENLTP